MVVIFYGLIVVVVVLVDNKGYMSESMISLLLIVEYYNVDILLVRGVIVDVLDILVEG